MKGRGICIPRIFPDSTVSHPQMIVRKEINFLERRQFSEIMKKFGQMYQGVFPNKKSVVQPIHKHKLTPEESVTPVMEVVHLLNIK